MLACYCLQGKQLASGVIGLLTCQSHYNVSGINRTPCARLLRHPLAQRIPTEACECSVSLGLFPLSLCVIVCDQQEVLFSSPVISALFAHRGTLIYLSKTRLERLHPISLFQVSSL